MLQLAIIFLIVLAVWFFLKSLSSPSPEKVRKIYKYTLIILAVIVAAFLFRIGLPYFGAIVGFLAAAVPYIGRILKFIYGLKVAKSFVDNKKTSAAKSDLSNMTKKEAREILEVSEDATEQDIKNSYKQLMKKNHPDSGGTKYFASKLNKAKDTLLKG